MKNSVLLTAIFFSFAHQSSSQEVPGFLKNQNAECGSLSSGEQIFIENNSEEDCKTIDGLERCTFAIFLRPETSQDQDKAEDNDKEIGEVTLHPYKFRNKGYEGEGGNYQILQHSLEVETSVDKKNQGKGIGTLARRCLNFLVTELNSPQNEKVWYIISDVAHSNLNSLAMNNKICQSFNEDTYYADKNLNCTKFSPTTDSVVYAYKVAAGAPSITQTEK